MSDRIPIPSRASLIAELDFALKWSVERVDDTDDEAQAADARAYLAKLEADNERLRGLIKGAEREGEDRERCPWCWAWRKNHPEAEPHAPDCPAFTPDGVVR